MLALQCQTNNVAEYAGLIIGLEARSIFRAFKTSALHTLLSFCAGTLCQQLRGDPGVSAGCKPDWH